MRRLPFTFLVSAGLLAATQAWPAPPVSEATVKAAFVYNFSKFTEWPAETLAAGQGPIRLCLYGNRDPFLAALAEIDGKLTQNRVIRVRSVTQPTDFRSCHILALGESEVRQLPEALRAADASGVLTVSEIEGFAGAGGTIGLVVTNEKVQFEVNLDAAQRANLKLSSQLLKLARKVFRH